MHTQLQSQEQCKNWLPVWGIVTMTLGRATMALRKLPCLCAATAVDELGFGTKQVLPVRFSPSHSQSATIASMSVSLPAAAARKHATGIRKINKNRFKFITGSDSCQRPRPVQRPRPRPHQHSRAQARAGRVHGCALACIIGNLFYLRGGIRFL